MRHFLLLAAMALLFFVVPKSSFAQERFNLQEKSNHHFYFSAAVAGEQTDIMLESGIPALLVGRDFYERVLQNSGLTFEPSERQIRLLNDVYKIPFRAEGKVTVGNLVFDGPVFVLDGFPGISMPIQYLKMSDGKKAFISLDFQDKIMTVNAQKPDVEGEKFKLRIDKKMGFPIVRSVLKMKTEDGTVNLKGDFIVDFGNPELLFLMAQRKDVDKAVKSGKLTLIDILDPETFEVIGNVIKTESTVVCGRKFEGKWVAVTDKMLAIEQLGFLGIPFFQKTVVFDFSGGEMIVQ